MAASATATTVVVARMPAPRRCQNASTKRDESSGGTWRGRPARQRGGQGVGAVGAPGGCRHGGRGDEYRGTRDGVTGPCGTLGRQGGPMRAQDWSGGTGHRSGRGEVFIPSRLGGRPRNAPEVAAAGPGGTLGRQSRRRSGSCRACGAPCRSAVPQGESTGRTGRGRPAGRRDGWAVGAARAPGGRCPFLPRSQCPSLAAPAALHCGSQRGGCRSARQDDEHDCVYHAGHQYVGARVLLEHRTCRPRSMRWRPRGGSACCSGRGSSPPHGSKQRVFGQRKKNSLKDN